MHRFALALVALLLTTSHLTAQTQPSAEPDAPAPLEGPKNVALPAPVDAVTPAGGGRYLLLRIDKLAKLAIYDVALDRIKGYIPLGSADTLVAGGADKLVLVARDKNVIQRWKIDPPEKELTVALVVSQVDAAVMGHASQGPLLLMTRSGPQFFSLQTLKPADVSYAGGNGTGDWRPPSDNGMLVNASADGQSFAGWYRGLSPSGLRLMRVQGANAVSRYEHDGAGTLIPSWDGSLVFTSNGIFSSDLKPVNAEQFRQKVCIPAYRPGYFLTVSSVDPSRQGPNSGVKPATTLSLYTTADRSLLVTLPPMTEITAQRDATGPGSLDWQQRVFLVPQCRRLVTVADTRDQLVVRPFDLMAALDRAGIDYLFVDSLPVTVADPGRPYRYPIAAQSKKGGIRFSLDSGPAGMTISRDGVLSWQVPANAEPGPIGVIVTIEDASGQNVFHTFNVQVTENSSRPGSTAKRIQLGPESNGAGRGQPPIVRAVRKPSKGTSTAKTE
jgi:hypothetical protein